MLTTMGIGIILVGVLVMLLGLGAASSANYPSCSECGLAQPDGFDSWDDKGHFYCRSCTRKRGMRPWYWKDCLGPWPGKEVRST